MTTLRHRFILPLLALLALLPGLPSGALAQAKAAAGAKPALASHDASLPIEIEADELTVEQSAQRAVFNGHVVAVQGNLSLRSEHLVVLYALDGAGGGSAAASQAIRRIEVDGGVTLASPNETATGKSGYYDVADQVIVLTDDVTLTRDANVLKGSKLTIDLATSKATMSADPKGATRVRALFVPPPKEKKP